VRKIIYFIIEAFRGFYQAKLMTFVSIMTIAATLFLICGVFIALMNIDDILNKAGDMPDAVVYLSDGVSGDLVKRGALIDSVRKMPGVKAVAFQSKDSAWVSFEATYGAEMLEAVDENPFAASLDVTLYESSQTSQAAAELQEMISALNGVEAVRYSRDWFDYIKMVRDRFYIISMAAGIIIISRCTPSSPIL